MTATDQSRDINTATIGDFMRVKGVGRRTAEAIVAYRRRHGPFRSVEDLLRVDGVSKVLAERIALSMQAVGQYQ